MPVKAEDSINYHIKDINFVDIFEDKIYKTDIFVIDGKIAKSKNGKKIHRVINGGGLYLLPGFVDLHTHSRGLNEKEKNTLQELQKSAYAGGYLHLLLMPNTNPPIDSVGALKSLKEEARNIEIKLYFSGCLTKGRNGKEYAPYFSLVKEGVVAFSDDGGCVQDSSLLYNIAKILKELNSLIIEHAELYELTLGSCATQSLMSTLYGIDSSPSINENIIVYRDLCIAKETSARLHLTHLSTAESIRIINAFNDYYKMDVSFDVTPHHLLLSCEDITRFDGLFNVKPFLKSKKETEMLQNALIKNAINIIATVHAPNTAEEKKLHFMDAPYGFIGLEFSFGLLFTFFVRTGKIGLIELVKKFSLNPASILKINLKDALYKYANFCIWDLNQCYTITPENITSRAKNTPFLGYKIFGRVKYVFLNGKVKFSAEG